MSIKKRKTNQWTNVSVGLTHVDYDEWDCEACERIMNTGAWDKKRRMRVQVAVGTLHQSMKMMFRKEILDSRSRVEYHSTPTGLTLPSRDGEKQTTLIEVWTGDCLVAAQLLQGEGYNPALLNMANQYGPGGGWEDGDGAQEENMFRRTSYWASLISEPNQVSETLPEFDAFKWQYPLDDFGTVYSPDVLIFRGTEATGYPFVKYPPSQRKVTFVAAAAYRDPPCGPPPDFKMRDTEHKGTYKKILGILYTALYHGHDSIVLSALGCGAFGNPPNIVAEIFKDALLHPAIANRFKKVVFAIFNDENCGGERNPIGNVKPFEVVFGKSKKIEDHLPDIK